MKWKSILVFLFIILILSAFSGVFYESFDDYSIDFYVITLRHEDRIRNIQVQNMKIPEKNINMIDAVKGDELSTDVLLSQKKIDPLFYSEDPKEKKIKQRELGCYMSHLKTYKTIKEKKAYSGYSIVFEDDFFLTDSFMENIQKILQKLREQKTVFDIIFLGQVLSENKGEYVADMLYQMDRSALLVGAQGLLINNAHIDTIIEKLDGTRDVAFDHKLANLGKSGDLNILVVHPFLVTQGGVSNSTIQDVNIENFDYQTSYSAFHLSPTE
jgi:GR25 family glycosyltransferase involved in LPS biosynthesis